MKKRLKLSDVVAGQAIDGKPQKKNMGFKSISGLCRDNDVLRTTFYNALKSGAEVKRIKGGYEVYPQKIKPLFILKEAAKP
jgi:hypothetical protein